MMNLTRVVSLVCCGVLFGIFFVPTGEPAKIEAPRVVGVLPATDASTTKETNETENALQPVNLRFARETAEVPDFQRHVGPLLGRLGCNGRACHGSFQGQGGFQLTLFGYDFDADHQALTADGSLRVDLEDSESSLVLAKPTDAEDHGGGLRFEESSWQYRLIKNWIDGGAKNFDDEQQLVKLTVIPDEIIASSGSTEQLQVVAQWSDGVSEDVTPLVRFQSNDPQIASIDSAGKVTGGSNGDTNLIVFYDNQVINVPVVSPVGPVGTATASDYFERPTRIDELVVAKLNKLGIQPSAIADDATFLRRISLDISGTLPSPSEIRSFLKDTRSEKRSLKIEQLLESQAYVAKWTNFLCDLTGNSTSQLRNVTYNGMANRGWYEWIFKRISENMPYDEMVQGIVVSATRLENESLTGYSKRMSADYQEGSASRFSDSPTMPYFWMRQDFRSGETLAISFAHSFLGVRLQCAQCHKHPFDQWTKQDFQQFSRFFSGVRSVQPQLTIDRKEQDELKTIINKLDLKPELRGGNLRRKFGEAARNGKVAPFAQLAVGPAKKSRKQLQAEANAKLAEAKRTELATEAAGSAEMQSEMDAMEADSSMDSSMQGTVDGGTDESMESGKQQKTDQAADATTNEKPLTKKERQRLNRQRKLERQREARRIRNERNRNRFFTDAILLGSESVELKDFKDARLPAMNWLKHPQNPYFAKAIVNRIWAQYFGVGIVQPADDLNLANPPSNGPLLEYLTNGFVENGYDLKWLHREITSSNIYQLSWSPNSTNISDRRNFSHALPRRLSAEVVFDALEQATASGKVNAEFREQLKSRAITMTGTAAGRRDPDRGDINFSMRIFGKSNRNNSCDCDRSDETSLTQTVFLRNDRHVHEQLARQDGWIGKMNSEIQKKPLSRKQARQLVSNEERLGKLRLALRKAKNGDDEKLVQQLKNKVRRLDNSLKPIRARRNNRVQKDRIEYDVNALVTEAWLRTLSRFPTDDEMRHCKQFIENDENVANGLTGVMWSLMNTKEFIVNH